MNFNLITKHILHNGFLKLMLFTVKHELFNSGMSETLDREVLIKNDAVAAVVYHREAQKFLLVNQFRAAAAESDNPWITELVAGHIDDGETPREAIVREIEEEIGYKPQEVQEIASFYTSPGYTDERIILFYCEVDDSMKVAQGGGRLDEHEDIQVLRFSPEEIRNALKSGEVRDAKTLIGLQHRLLNREN